MPMGLTVASATYARLKDLMFGPIPQPYAQLTLVAEYLRPEECNISSDCDISFRYFFDDGHAETAHHRETAPFAKLRTRLLPAHTRA